MPQLKIELKFGVPVDLIFFNVKNFNQLPFGKIYCSKEKCVSLSYVLLLYLLLFSSLLLFIFFSPPDIRYNRRLL